MQQETKATHKFSEVPGIQVGDLGEYKERYFKKHVRNHHLTEVGIHPLVRFKRCYRASSFEWKRMTHMVSISKIYM